MQHSGAPESAREAATAWVAIGQWRLGAWAQSGALNTIGECGCMIRRPCVKPQEASCCADGSTACWRHALTNQCYMMQ